ncbi:MAG: type IV secretory system conjugative DNA transfer family protein [Clostridiales bacterium]|nr:type IV secretory system conjugative DNA transfer family protein [Clostridiales bacterium]
MDIGHFKKEDMLFISIGFLITGVVSIILTPAVIAEGNIFDKINIAGYCLSHPFDISFTSSTYKVILATSFIYIICICIYLADKQNTRFNEEYGSAKWGDVSKLCRKYSDKNFSKNRLLTQNLRISETGKKVFLNLITLVIGGSGAGKSFYYCIPNLLQAQGSYIVLDPSGELLERTGAFLHSSGYKIKALNLDDMDDSFRYNPFEYIKTDDDVLRLCENIFRATVPKESHSNDPMWDNQAKAMLMAYMFLIFYEAGEDEKNMRVLMYIAREDTAEEDEEGNIKDTAISTMFDKLELENPEHIAVRFYKTARKGTAKTILGVQTTLMGRLNKFNLESVCRLTDCDELELYEIGKEKTTLFLVIPAEDKSFNFIISMLYSQLIPILYKQARESRGKRLEVPVHFLMDEFSNVILPGDFLTVLTTARKHDISFSILIQAISQLKPMFEKEQFNTLIGNADEFVYLGSGEFETQKYISERIGKETIIVKSHNLTKGIRGSFTENSQPVARELLTASEVDTFLGEKQALVKLRGNDWVIDEKIKPQSHPNYKYTSDVTGKAYKAGDASGMSAVIQYEDADTVSSIDIEAENISADIYNRINIITDEELVDLI